MEDPCFNALLIVSELALAEMAGELDSASAPHTARAARLARRLVLRLWDDTSGLFRVRDLATHPLVDERSVTGLVPLAVPHLSRDIVRRLHGTLDGPHFKAPATHLIPGYDLTGPAFDPHRYWRGPACVDTA
nr:hypothetical protein [Streptomyces sp. MMG1533]